MSTLNNDKNVYILGAGFSKEIGLPLQDDFLLVAKEVYFRDPSKYKHFEKVFNYQNTLAKMRNFLSYPLLNLEHLFNLLEMDDYFSNREEVKGIKNDFLRLITDVLVELTPKPFYYDHKAELKFENRYNNYIKFLNLFIKEDEPALYDDTIISFNYDLVIEATVCLHNIIDDGRKKWPISPELDIKSDEEQLITIDEKLSKYFNNSPNENYLQHIGVSLNKKSNQAINPTTRLTIFRPVLRPKV